MGRDSLKSYFYFLLDWHDFLNRPNPVASALMAKMKIAPQDRPLVKARCIAMLTGLQLDKARTELITGFVDTYLDLNPQEEEMLLEAELDTLDPDLETRVRGLQEPAVTQLGQTLLSFNTLADLTRWLDQQTQLSH